MAIFKCKMCGGDLQINENVSVGECSYCGTRQTLPRLDDDKRANLYERANHFRRNGEFDKAAAIYDSILNEDKTDAEAYWSLVLCKYGIEYVEDPKTKKRVPTCNCAQVTSIFVDEDYKQAIAYADASAKVIYETEAKAIDEIQKGILAISANEEPYDVFICYKETDNDGRRTPDSVLANELYHQLIQEEFKVFFSRITLEDKLGTAYEPYIFAALNSAKVMVVIGTKPEYFNAVWVRNEWRRYLILIKNGNEKVLIPTYRDMDPYDLPDEFSNLQAQDMTKLGFMQDLVRGIRKITKKDEKNNNAEVPIKFSFGNREEKNWDDYKWHTSQSDTALYVGFEDFMHTDYKFINHDWVEVWIRGANPSSGNDAVVFSIKYIRGRQPIKYLHIIIKGINPVGDPDAIETPLKITGPLNEQDNKTYMWKVAWGRDKNRVMIERVCVEYMNGEKESFKPSDLSIRPSDINPVNWYNESREKSTANQSSNATQLSGCYVATAVYGSYDCPQVWTLRRYRDYTLSKTWYGRAFIYAYYAISPSLVACLSNTTWIKKMFKSRLDRMVAKLKSQGVEDFPYQDRK